MNQSRGFTLIELLIVVAIIAVLAAIAVPAYSRYSYRARRADGQQLLQNIAIAQERFYATNNRYGSMAEVGFGTTSTATSQNGYYFADIPAGAGTSAQAFTAVATPQNGQQADACGTLQITNTGLKSPAASNTTANSNGNCW